MATQADLLKLLPGREVVISSCEAREHGDNAGCLCKLIGTRQVIRKLYDTPFAGTPTWHLSGSEKRVRLSEITILVDA